jgi:hypothetical protein
LGIHIDEEMAVGVELEKEIGKVSGNESIARDRGRIRSTYTPKRIIALPWLTRIRKGNSAPWGRRLSR